MYTVTSENTYKAVGPYSSAVRADDLLFLSGVIGLDPKTNQLRATFAEEVRQIFKNALAILDEENMDMSNVIKTTVFIVDMNKFQEMNEIYAHEFGDTKPARSTVGVASLPKGANIEIEFVATPLSYIE